MKKVGYILLQIAACLVLLGGMADLLMPFFIHSLPEAHAKYLRLNNEDVSLELINFDHAFIRAIGGCLIAIGIGMITIIYGALKTQTRSVLIPLLLMVTTGEGINTLQMLSIHSPYFFFPLICLIFTWVGGIVWWVGNSRKQE